MSGASFLTGGSPASIVAMLEGLECGRTGYELRSGSGADERDLKGCSGGLLRFRSSINPNAGLPRTRTERRVYDIDAAHFAKTEEEIVDMGAWIVGGCCGTTPEHIRMVAERLPR
ncbi:MAG: homocysteine S-methyltransferase family protein [Clostridium sp.]